MKKALLAIAVLLCAIYGADYLSAKFRLPGNREVFTDLRVDQLYTATNKWNQVEWSRGDPVTERCVNSLLPQLGYTPCWYLKRHRIRVNKAD